MKVISKALIFITSVFVLICISQVSAENPYRVLGVSKYSSMSHIKKVYKELAKKYHPDKNKGKSEEETLEIRKKFYAIQSAFETIKEEKGLGINSAADGDQYESELDLMNSMITTAITTLLYLAVLYTVYYFFAFIMGVLDFLFNYFFYTCIVHAVIDLFFSHNFDSAESQTVATIFTSLIIVIGRRYMRKPEIPVVAVNNKQATR